MAKKITGYIKLQIPAGKANPSPPIGPALGQHGVNIMEFCKAFNAKTRLMRVRSLRLSSPFMPTAPSPSSPRPRLFRVVDQDGDRSKSGSGVPNKNKVGKLTKDQVGKLPEEDARSQCFESRSGHEDNRRNCPQHGC